MEFTKLCSQSECVKGVSYVNLVVRSSSNDLRFIPLNELPVRGHVYIRLSKISISHIKLKQEQENNCNEVKLFSVCQQNSESDHKYIMNIKKKKILQLCEWQKGVKIQLLSVALNLNIFGYTRRIDMQKSRCQ